MEYMDRVTYGCIKLYKENKVERVQCTCIHVLMHVHIIIKVWDCKRSDQDIHRENMCCIMPGYIAIIGDSCTVLRSGGPISLQL